MFARRTTTAQLKVVSLGLSRTCGRSSDIDDNGSNTMAPSMFTRNMNVSRMPMSAWNLSGAKIHVPTPIQA